jgi:hypothetical protein
VQGIAKRDVKGLRGSMIENALSATTRPRSLHLLTAALNRTPSSNGNRKGFENMPTFIRPALIKAAQHVQSRTFTNTSRIMAPKQEWMAIIPDHAGALAKRMEVRP